MSSQIQYRNTVQRNKMLEVLRSVQTHPTAEWLYAQLKSDLPNLSMGTVYRNLGILEKQELVQKLDFGLGTSHYDGNVNPHPHFVCLSCGRVYDLHIPDFSDHIAELNHRLGHQIEHCVVKYSGICQECCQ